MSQRFPIGSVAMLYFDLIASGTGQTGQSPVLALERRADGRWYNATRGVFQPSYIENAMREFDALNLPGRYAFDFDHSKDELVSTEFVVKYANAGSSPALRYDEIGFGPLASVARPGLCSIQGTIFGLNGEARPGELVQATLIPVLSDSLGRGYESDALKRTHSGADGSFDLSVVQGATIRLEIRAMGYDRRVFVPNRASVLFTDL